MVVHALGHLEQTKGRWAWRHTPVIPALGRQESHGKFKVSQSLKPNNQNNATTNKEKEAGGGGMMGGMREQDKR